MKTPKTRIALAALAAGVFALAGCDQPAEPDAATPTPSAEDAAESPDAAAAPAAGDERFETGEPKVLNLFCWSEYVPDDVIAGFTELTGIRVNVENYASNEEMLAKLLAGGGQYDLIQPSEYIIEALVKEDMLREIDPEAVPNLRHLAPEFRELAFDPGNKFSVPWMAGTVGIVVNTELVDEPVTSYSDVFQEKFRNNIVVLDDAREIVSWALMSQGLSVNDVTEESIATITPILSQWLPLVRVYDSDSPKTALINGDVAVGIVWSGEAALLLDEDEKFTWTLPEEGAHLFVDSLAIPKTAAHPKNAELFMNYILRPRVSARISDEFPYLNPNLAARELLEPEQLANAASFPTTEEIESMETFEDIGPMGAEIDDLITTIKVQ